MAALGFDPRRSDLPMRAAYPLLISNALAWASGHAAEGGASAAAATGGSVLSSDGVTEVPVTHVGFHSLRGEVVAANLSDARESDTTPSPQLILAGRPLAAPESARTAPTTTPLALWPFCSRPPSRRWSG